MKNSISDTGVGPALTRRGEIEARTAKAIDSGDFKAYQHAIMHDWLRTLTLMASFLVPLFFVLDLFMMPASLLPHFAVYRGASTLIALLQLVVVRKTSPSRWSYLHGYLMTLQVGGMIALMTADLGGFSSSYYAGLNLVVIGVNLLSPWGAAHTAANAALTVGLYLLVNLLAGLPTDRSLLVNNLFFLVATAILATAINYVRTMLLHREFTNLVELGEARDELVGEKERVEDRERSLASLLDLSGQGFLSFDREYVVQTEYSKECDRIFGRDIAGMRIDELLYADETARATFRSGLDLYFGGRSKAEVIFDLLDHTLGIGGRTMETAYRAIDERRVMLVLTDITDELRLQEESRRENEKWNLLLKVISNRSFFSSFDREAEALFSELEQLPDSYEGLVRDIHTFKSNAAFLGFYKTQNAAHELEDYIADRVVLGQEIEPAGPAALLRSSFAEERAIVSETLGSEWALDAQSIELKRSEYMMIESHIKMNCPDQPIIDVIEEHRRKPLAELLGRFPQMIADLAARMGKRIAPVTVLGDDVSIVADDFEDLIASFSHIIRNMVDHGIERPREREAKGKSPVGAVGIDIKEESGEIVFTFSDDGKGILLSEVRKRAEDLGLVEKAAEVPPSELVSFIFRDGFSTSTTVNEISGRGVGLPAVREAVQKMGGRIRVQTALDRGTVFTIAVPDHR